VFAFFACFGMSLRFVPMPMGLRATILLGVGGAMLVGAAGYVLNFAMATPIKAKLPTKKKPRQKITDAIPAGK
jgi:hypothetical protein